MRILVIEDDPKHIADAKEFFAGYPDIRVSYVSELYEAFGYLGFTQTYQGPHEIEEPSVDGVISDIFFNSGHPYGRRGADGPLGVVTFFLCKQRGIPCVLNTAGFHHGDKYQWIHELAMWGALPKMIDAAFSPNEEAVAKNWERAFEGLMELINTNKGNPS
jgi:hypothetical protein